MGNYDKHICTTLERIELQPGPTKEEKIMLANEGRRIMMDHVLWLDADVLAGGYYGESAWIWPGSYPNQISQEELAKRTTPGPPMFPHYHEFPELLSWWGSDPDNPDDTSTMGMVMGDEEILLDGSWVGYIPAKMYHMPTRVADGRVTGKPVFHWTAGPGMYTRDKDDDHDEEEKDADIPVPGQPKKDTQENKKYFVMGGDQKEPPAKLDYMSDSDPKYYRHLVYIDETVVPDCEYGCNTMFLLPGNPSKAGIRIMEPHTLPYGTNITLVSLNYADVTDLRGEAELWIGGEKHIIKKNFGAYSPPGIEQGPLIVRNVEKQLFFSKCNPVGKGIEKFPGGQ